MAQDRETKVFSLVQGELEQLQQQVAHLQAHLAWQQQHIATLQASETRHRAIIEQTMDAILVVSGGMIQFVNPAAEAMFGYQAADVIGMYMDIAFVSGQPLEVDILCKDGSRGVGEMRVAKILWDDSLAYLASFRDITDRKRAEDAIQRAHATLEQRTQELYETNHHLQCHRDVLHTIFNGIDDGLVLVDNHNCILAANRSVAMLLGCNVAEVINKPLPGLFRPPQGERTPDLLFPNFWVAQTLRDGRPRRRRERIISPDGTAHTLDMQALPIFDPGDTEQQVVQVLLHMVDVTEKLKVDALMMENERLNATRKLTEIVVHEVNTPLQTIMSLLGMLTDANNEERATYIQLSRDEIKRISMIMNQLRSVYHTPPDKHLPVDINSLVERVVVLMSGRFAKEHIHVERQLSPSLPLVYCHADEITQVLLNMFANAIEAMPNGGIVHVQTNVLAARDRAVGKVENEAHRGLGNAHLHPDDTKNCLVQGRDTACLHISISDSGTGIDPAVLPHIFEPFFTTKKHGSGIGLFVSHKIITQHGGQVIVESIPEQGSTVTLVLPLAQGKDEQPALLVVD